jgi:hypothetical protein
MYNSSFLRCQQKKQHLFPKDTAAALSKIKGVGGEGRGAVSLGNTFIEQALWLASDLLWSKAAAPIGASVRVPK